MQPVRTHPWLFALGFVLSVGIWMCIPTQVQADGGSGGKSGVTPHVINLPSGPGSVQGLGNAFQPQLNTGTASYPLSLVVPPGVGGHTPALNLIYNGGRGNGPFGMGWQLDLPYIQRQTDKGLPQYRDDDFFIHSSGEELVPLADGTFRFKVESTFTRFRRLNEHWEAIERNGARWIFGETENARQSNALGVFLWFPQRIIDTNDNEIRFFYHHDNGQIYLQEIRYNFNRTDPFGTEQPNTYIRIQFMYESRPDRLVDYRSRFPIHTNLRARTIEITALGQRVRRYELGYTNTSNTSLLSEVRQLGTDLARFEEHPSGALPPLRFAYTAFDPAAATSISMSNPPPVRAGSPNADLVDINSDSLPDMVFTDLADGHRFYLNKGHGRWDPQARYPSQSPPDVLQTSGVQLADMDGDGRSDLLVKSGDTTNAPFYYYPNRGGSAWELAARVNFAFNPPFTFEDRDLQLIDLDNDKRIDILRTTESAYYVYFNKTTGWSGGPDRILPVLTYGAVLLLSDPRVKLADMNGDRLLDMVFVTAEQVIYFPSRGLGDFDSAVQMIGSPVLFERAGEALLGDINGDGLADLLLVDHVNVHLWLNQTGSAYRPEALLPDTPTFIADETTLRLADMNGDGATDLLYSRYPAPDLELFRYLDFSQGTLPYLLRSIDNGLGRTIEFSYQTSTDYYVADWDANAAWTLQSPVPVTVVAQSTVHDLLSNQTYVTNYTYRNAYYDAEEKAFRGFALAEQIDYGDGSAPTQRQRLIFDTGALDKSRKGLILQQDILGADGSCGSDLPLAALSAATTGLKIQAIHPNSARQHWRNRSSDHLDYPWEGEAAITPPEPISCYQRTMNQLQTRTLGTGTDSRVVSFSTISQTDVLNYEGTPLPKRTQQTVAYDDNGNPIRQFEFGEVALDGTHPGLGSDERLTYTTYATNPMVGISDRITQIRITDLAGNFVSEQRRYYDGAAFIGLPLGQVVRGNTMRQEDNLGPAAGNRWVQSQRVRYDRYGNQIATLDPNGVLDANGAPTNGHWSSIEFDPIFHSYPIVESIHISATHALTMTASYDFVLGVITRATDFNQQEQHFRYDALARPTALVKPGDSLAFPTQVFSYTLGAPISSVTTHARETSGHADVFRTVSYFDGLGRGIQSRSEGEDGRIIVRDAVTFNTRGKERERYLPYYAATATFAYAPPEPDKPKTTIQYDPLLRPVRTSNPDDTFSRTLYHPFEQVLFDEEDNNPASPHVNTPTILHYDGRGRQVHTIEQNGTAIYTSTYGYDTLDNLTTITDAQGNFKHQLFDALGRKLVIDDPDRGRFASTYDDVGNILETTDVKGQRIRYTYDGANRRLTEQTIPLPGDTSLAVRYHYDGDLASEYPDAHNTAGRLAWIEDASGRSYLNYDARGNISGRIKRITLPEGNEPLDFVLLTRHDAMNRPVETMFPDGTTLAYQYNDQAQLEAIPGYTTAIDYTASGQRSAIITTDGVRTGYMYDSRLRLMHMHALDRQNSLLLDLHYLFDGVSNLLGIDDGRLGCLISDNDSRAFTVDDLYRLTSVRYTIGAQDTIDYNYDSIGNLIRQTSTITAANLGDLRYGQSAGPHALTQVGSQAWRYDANGNLLAKPNFNYRWDPYDRLATVTGPNNLQQEQDYDYAGMRMSKVVRTSQGMHTTLYPYESVEVRGDQLINYVFAGTDRIAEVRTPFSRQQLIRGFDGAAPTLFGLDTNYDGMVEAEEIAARGGDPYIVESDEINDALTVFFAHTDDLHPPLTFATLSKAQDNNRTHASTLSVQGTIFYHSDHLGSATLLTDDQGHVIERNRYTPYGTERDQHAAPVVAHRFTGKEPDAETGLYYYGARFYDPVVGRFMSADPLWVQQPEEGLGRPQVLNMYAYGNNNPTRYTDPTGEDVWDSVKGFAQGVGTGFANTAVGAIQLTFGFWMDPSGTTQNAIIGAWQGASNTAHAYTWVAQHPSEFFTGVSQLSHDEIGRVIGEATWETALIVAPLAGWGARGTTANASSEIAISETWGNPSTLADHFTRHGADFGANSAIDYAGKASRFLQESQRVGLPTKIGSDGVIRVYDAKTNTFGSYNSNGTTRTFFKPEARSATNPTGHNYPSNHDYWNAQQGSPP